MKLYLDQFIDNPVVDLEFSLSPEEVVDLLVDTEFIATSPLEISLRARRSGSAIKMNGRASGDFRYECGRCLTERHLELDTNVEVVYLARAAWDASLGEEDEMELSCEDLDVAFYEGDEILLDEEIREEILLALPTFALCLDKDRPSCDEAYEALLAEANLDTEKIEKLEKEAADERWGPLKELKQKMFSGIKDSEN